MSGVRARLETEELHAVRCVRYVYVAVHGSLGCHLGVSFCYESVCKIGSKLPKSTRWYKVGAKQIKSCYEVCEHWYETGTKLVDKRRRSPGHAEGTLSCSARRPVLLSTSMTCLRQQAGAASCAYRKHVCAFSRETCFLFQPANIFYWRPERTY